MSEHAIRHRQKAQQQSAAEYSYVCTQSSVPARVLAPLSLQHKAEISESEVMNQVWNKPLKKCNNLMQAAHAGFLENCFNCFLQQELCTGLYLKSNGTEGM